MLIENAKGNFSFIRGFGPPFSSGGVASAGFDVVHVTLKPLARLSDGFALIERHTREAGRPINAVCGIELRIGKPLTQAGFDDFNRGYIERLKGWGVFVGESNPIARTNVALEVSSVAEPSMYGFYYTVPATGAARPAFVIAGAAEVASREGGRAEVVARDDVSTEGMRRKTACVLALLRERLEEMKVGWKDASGVNLYTVHDLHPIFATDLLPALGPAGQRGIRWHYARPPVVGLELEIDGYAAHRELVLTA
jgi:hypothetical protein